MEYIIVLAAIIFVLFLSKYFMIKKSKRNIGQRINFGILSPELSEKISGGKSLLYFWAQHCPQCRNQKPIIANLKNEFDNIVEVNVGANRDYAAAFGIMGTPTTMIVNKGIIKDIFVGVRSEAFLRNKILSVD